MISINIIIILQSVKFKRIVLSYTCLRTRTDVMIGIMYSYKAVIVCCEYIFNKKLVIYSTFIGT